MFWAFLCGLLFGGLLWSASREEAARRRNERIRNAIERRIRMPTSEWQKLVEGSWDMYGADAGRGDYTMYCKCAKTPCSDALHREAEKCSAEEFIAIAREALPELESWQCACDGKVCTIQLSDEEIPFSDPPLPEDAELPPFITGRPPSTPYYGHTGADGVIRRDSDLSRVGYVDSDGIAHFDGEF